MKHSVIYKENAKFIYRQNPDVMPNKQNGMESTKDFYIWNTETKIGLIKPQDITPFQKWLKDIDKVGEVGCPVPFEVIEFYNDLGDRRNYVRFKKDIVWDDEKGKIVGAKKECICCHLSYETEFSKNEFGSLCNDCAEALKELILKFKTSKLNDL